jgi:hypothetical protein
MPVIAGVGRSARVIAHPGPELPLGEALRRRGLGA